MLNFAAASPPTRQYHFNGQSEVYGDGFRMALDAYQAHGLVKLLAHVRQAGAFPPQT